ncbi:MULTISPECIES: sensor histidine kinase [Parasaccharibacter]|uniref:histidine kinase n=1 Tax=Parasaccharibacter apium TaxID=1510841 RepID=A0ABX4ZMM9_9PROT|nr:MULTISPECIES: HAMP domain-containing sensor histidine kinase [Parasaccharibacter]MCQ0041453.1 HAMP domain-containing histidine kinase [Bombella sp.]MUH02085.1 HAMP domain-containing protein [Bombella sp. ESL0387]QGT74562.1 HAMP domain-containing protein [Bombella sp. ESL0368]MCL1515896.1 sensor histidine kinase [Parasaccharibacter sp. TMW2.1890]POS61704.1 sensor histidine kinase [Parasaccharibacter apium]
MAEERTPLYRRLSRRHLFRLPLLHSRNGKRRWPIRSAGINFALGYGVLFLISATLFLSFIWWSSTNLLNDHVRAFIETDAQELRHRWGHGGAPALSEAINDRLEQNIDDDALYLLIDRHGRRMAGNLPGWPVAVKKMNHFYELTIRRYTFTTPAQFKAYTLPHGFKLIVGHDIRGRTLLSTVITRTLIWCAVMISLLAVGGALVVRDLFRRMVGSIARTASAVANGDLNHRIALTGSETDLVAETVNTMLDRINRLMEGVRQVSNAIAHDLRTPITRARNQLEEAFFSATSPDELRTAVDRAIGDLDHITGIFEALLRIAQIEAGARRSAFTTVNLNQLLSNMAELYEASAEDAGLSLALDVTPLPSLFGDERMLQQALANLLDNAIKFSPPNSTLTLSAHPVMAGTAPGSGAEKKPQGLEISVRDQGPGMNDADILRAHERFFRAESARNTPGSGLGLSLVQAVTSLHHGRLTLTQANPGLKVTLFLPLLPEAERTGRSTTPAETTP